MNDGITVVILSSNCKEGTKIASTSIYKYFSFFVSMCSLNKFYPVLKVYLQNVSHFNSFYCLLGHWPQRCFLSPKVSSFHDVVISRVLPRIETKYTLLVDGSVEFTLNTHLKRLLNVLKSGEAVIAGGAEEDERGVLTMRCYDVWRTDFSLDLVVSS